jgi:alginate O-acetyltransferase complex protein AlgI
VNFISSEFAVLLVLTVVAASGLDGRAITYVILASSLVFYGWWNPPYLLLLGAVIGISWAGALAIERWRTRGVVAVVVAAELLLLVYFKYTSFILRSVAALSGALGRPLTLSVPTILLPAGISFMTFQGVAYAVDVYRAELPAERSLLSVAVFKSFFPQLVAGPIERAAHLLPQLKQLEADGLRRARWGEGIFMVLKGALLKFVIADNMSVIVDGVYANPRSAAPVDVAMAVLAFSIQIYCDFYGYTMIALGSARLLGVQLVQNFSHPYLARNIQEFWRRWHISLSQWFRDYLYIPLGGSRVSRRRHLVNLLVVMVAVGLWHGASWTFVLWGAVHGVLLTAHVLWRRSAWANRLARVPGTSVLAWAITFAAVTLAWIPFRAADVHTQAIVFQKLAEWIAAPTASSSAIYGLPFYMALAVGFVILEVVDANMEIEPTLATLSAPWQAIAVFVCCLLTYLGPFKDVAFLYFQF